LSTKPDVALAVVQALVGLGWNERIAREAVDSLEVSPEEETSALLKRALAALSRGA
jgi:Holliday junction resolvasome RuvABC DNA-binding subunit